MAQATSSLMKFEDPDDIRDQIIQENGQVIYTAPNVTGPPPKGTEIFISHLPQNLTIHNLLPIVEQFGSLYNVRLMMEFGGGNRGFAYVRYKTLASAQKAVAHLNGYEISYNFYLKVAKSIDNCRLFIGQIRKTLKKQDVTTFLRNETEGLKQVIMYLSSTDKNLNRGFCFAEYEDHKSAAMARRRLITLERIHHWATPDANLKIDWAIPESPVDENVMSRVKVLYVRNLMLRTTESTLKEAICSIIPSGEIVRICKLQDFAFIHFRKREVAEKALCFLNGLKLDGAILEGTWAKPPPSDKNDDKSKKGVNSRRLNNNRANYRYLSRNNSQLQSSTDSKLALNNTEITPLPFPDSPDENIIDPGPLPKTLNNTQNKLSSYFSIPYNLPKEVALNIVTNMWASNPPFMVIFQMFEFFRWGSVSYKLQCQESPEKKVLYKADIEMVPHNQAHLTVNIPSSIAESAIEAKNKAAVTFFNEYIGPECFF